MKMATLEEEKARLTAIMFCVETVMTSNDSFKHLKNTNVYSGISGSLVFKWHGRFRDGWTESTQHGRKPFMNVRNALSADGIASSVLTFSGQREVYVSDSTGRYIVYGSVTYIKSLYKHSLCIAHNGVYLYKG